MYNDSPRISLDSTSGNPLSMNDERLNYQMTTMSGTDALYLTPAIPVDISAGKGDDGKSPLQFIDYEKSEPIVRFLAQVRKLGMDILFPQSTHDKVKIHIRQNALSNCCFVGACVHICFHQNSWNTSSSRRY
jgi:hypothetical protein